MYISVGFPTLQTRRPLARQVHFASQDETERSLRQYEQLGETAALMRELLDYDLDLSVVGQLSEATERLQFMFGAGLRVKFKQMLVEKLGVEVLALIPVIINEVKQRDLIAFLGFPSEGQLSKFIREQFVESSVQVGSR